MMWVERHLGRKRLRIHKTPSPTVAAVPFIVSASNLVAKVDGGSNVACRGEITNDLWRAVLTFLRRVPAPSLP